MWSVKSTIANTSKNNYIEWNTAGSWVGWYKEKKWVEGFQ